MAQTPPPSRPLPTPGPLTPAPRSSINAKGEFVPPPPVPQPGLTPAQRAEPAKADAARDTIKLPPPNAPRPAPPNPEPPRPRYQPGESRESYNARGAAWRKASGLLTMQEHTQGRKITLANAAGTKRREVQLPPDAYLADASTAAMGSPRTRTSGPARSETSCASGAAGRPPRWASTPSPSSKSWLPRPRTPCQPVEVPHDHPGPPGPARPR